MRFGVIGCGAIGRLRAEALHKTPGGHLHLVTDVDPRRSTDTVTRFGGHTVSSVEELVRSGDVDAVVVSTPPNLHRAHCEAALSAGKHVLCEKPLATTVADCRALVEAAERHGRILATGFNYRFYPVVSKARDLIAGGAIGKLDHVVSFAGHPGGPEFTHPWVHDVRVVGGGALMDNGIHLADLTLHFLGDVVESHRIATDHIWDFSGSEDNGYVMMRTAEGRVGLLHASWTEWRGYHFWMDLYGTHGCIRLSYPPMAMVLHTRPTGRQRRGSRRVFFFPRFQVLERLRSYRWSIVQSFIAEQVDFMARIRGCAGVGATGVDGLRAVRLATTGALASQLTCPQRDQGTAGRA
jgi:predicted dehydrogenase